MEEFSDFKCSFNFLPNILIPTKPDMQISCSKKEKNLKNKYAVAKPSEVAKQKEEEKNAKKEEKKWKNRAENEMEGRMIQKKVRKKLPEKFEELLKDIMTAVLTKKPCAPMFKRFILKYLDDRLNERTAEELGVKKYDEFDEKDYQDLTADFMAPSKKDKPPPGMQGGRSWFQDECKTADLPLIAGNPSTPAVTPTSEEVSEALRCEESMAEDGEASAVDTPPVINYGGDGVDIISAPDTIPSPNNLSADESEEIVATYNSPSEPDSYVSSK